MLMTVNSKAKNSDELIKEKYEEYINDAYYVIATDECMRVLTVNDNSKIRLPFSPSPRLQHYNHIATACEKEAARDCDINYIVRNFAGPSDPILLESAYQAIRSGQLRYSEGLNMSIPDIIDAYDALDNIEEDFYKLEPDVRRKLFHDDPLQFASQLAAHPEETLSSINSMSTRVVSTPTVGPLKSENSEQNSKRSEEIASEISPSTDVVNKNST
ncbi:hypothetical protein [Dipodfec virus UOA04_Rod_1048]|nr:hypothetical protein [Dipodfec virus UOA04_Rod_1048]